jgi:hypothetical protein
MPRNEEVFLQGKVKWARTKIPGQYGKWSVVLYPDAPSLDKIQELIKDGIKNELKKDDDGYYMTFSRPLDKTDRQGRKFSFTPPTVVDRENRVLEGMVGNGSDCSIKLDIYGGTRPGGGTYKAARLDGIKVFNLVPYVPEESSNDPRIIKSVSGLDKQPEPVNRW